MIPDRIREGATAAHEAMPPSPYGRSQGVPGEISIAAKAALPASDTEVRRLVAVLETSDETRTATILLVTNEIENATDLDLIVDPGDAGLPYATMIQSELYGPLFIEQLQGRLGWITDDVRHAVAGALASDGESLDGYKTGLPLGDFADPRRAFKVRELDELEQLVAECRRWLGGEPADVRLLDPELLLPPPPGTPIDDAADQFLELLDVLNEMGERSVSIPAGLLDSLSDVGFVDEVCRWRTDFGFDTSRVLSVIRVIDEEMHTATRSDGSHVSDRRTASAINRYLEGQAERGCLVIEIHTVARCWSDQPEVLVVEANSGYACRARGRLLEAA
jgi:hypothetical protein